MYKSTYPKRFSVKTNKLVIGFLLLIFCGTVSAQRLNVVDHRGTKGTTGNTCPIVSLQTQTVWIHVFLKENVFFLKI